MTIPSGAPAVLGLILFLLFFQSLFGGIFVILLRTGVSLLFLRLLAQIPFLSCLTLGVNLFNALVLGILGIPGFGLLLLLRWILFIPA